LDTEVQVTGKVTPLMVIGADVDWRRAGERDEVAIGAEVSAVVQSDRKICRHVRRDQAEQIAAPLAEVGLDRGRTLDGAAVRTIALYFALRTGFALVATAARSRGLAGLPVAAAISRLAQVNPIASANPLNISLVGPAR